jgi:hypothetical protein
MNLFSCVIIEIDSTLLIDIVENKDVQTGVSIISFSDVFLSGSGRCEPARGPDSLSIDSCKEPAKRIIAAWKK